MKPKVNIFYRFIYLFKIDCILIKKEEKEFENILSTYKIKLNEFENKEKPLALIKLGNIVILLNSDSNLRIIVCSKDVSEDEKSERLNDIYNETKSFTKELEKYLQFEFNYK